MKTSLVGPHRLKSRRPLSKAPSTSTVTRDNFNDEDDSSDSSDSSSSVLDSVSKPGDVAVAEGAGIDIPHNLPLPNQPLSFATQGQTRIRKTPQTRSAPNKHDPPVIRKPKGQTGRPRRGGYKLEEQLGWDHSLVSEVESFVESFVLGELDMSLPFINQSTGQLHKLHKQAVTKFPFLQQYEDCWVVDDMARCILKRQQQKLVKEANASMAAKRRTRELAREQRKAQLTEIPTDNHLER
ncbi:hypothetical protein PQX77_015501 [Marasmius sp. AFHP31]|nr:hypothetical protein PQX77_015501 [Marasmius sp. AFHP31]